MTVAGVCPACGSPRPLAEFLSDARERQALAAALRLDPRLADPLLAYLDLFAVPGKKLQSRKLVRLLTELHGLVSSAQVARNGVSCAAPVEYWRTGMEEVVARRDALTLPLTGHGYLQTVVFSLAGKAAGQSERKAEEDKRYRYARSTEGGPKSVGETLDAVKRSGPPAGWKDALFNRGGGDDA